MPHNAHHTLNTVTFCSDCTVALYCAGHAPGVLDYSLQLWPKKKQFFTQFVLAVLLDFLVMRLTLVHHRFKVTQHNTQPSELAALSVGDIIVTSALRFSRQLKKV